MEIPIEAPHEIKKKIAKRLQKNGALKRIERKIKLGMMVAVEEIREDPQQKGNLERKRFKDASPHELKSLQAVYNFLSERNMTYTLSTLLEESCVRRSPTDTTDILDLVSSDVEDNIEENSQSDQFSDEENDENIQSDYDIDSYEDRPASNDRRQPPPNSNRRQGMPIKKKSFEKNSVQYRATDL